MIAYSFTLIELAAELLLPFLLGKMINEGVTNLDMNNIIFWGSIMLGISCISLIVGILNSYFASHTSNGDRKSTGLNSSHVSISYAVFCLKKKKKKKTKYCK